MMQENYQNNLNVENNNELSQPAVIKPEVAKYKWAILGTVLITLVVLFCYLILTSYSGFSFAGFGFKSTNAVTDSKSDFYWIDYNSDDGVVYSWRFTGSDSCERTDLTDYSTEYFDCVDNGSFLSIDNDRIVIYYDYNEGVYWYYSPDLKYKCLLCKSETNEYDTDKASCYKYRADIGKATVNEVNDTIENAEQNEIVDEDVTESSNNDMSDIYNLSSAEIYERYFERAANVFGFFDGGYLEYYDNEPYDYNGMTYFRIKGKQSDCSYIDFSSYDKFSKSINNIFTKEFTSKLLESDNYINVNGELYGLPLGRGGDLSYLESKFTVSSVKDDKIVFTVYSEYVKEEYYDVMFDNIKITDDMKYTHELEFVMKKQNGKWLFDNFELWY